MGNARWKGVRLKDVLAKAGIGKDAVEVAFNGADSGALEATPDFVKSIPAWKAMDENTLIAWEMNGEPIPHWNGAPARIVVPGWTAPYWMKQVVSIRAHRELQRLPQPRLHPDEFEVREARWLGGRGQEDGLGDGRAGQRSGRGKARGLPHARVRRRRVSVAGWFGRNDRCPGGSNVHVTAVE